MLQEEIELLKALGDWSDSTVNYRLSVDEGMVYVFSEPSDTLFAIVSSENVKIVKPVTLYVSDIERLNLVRKGLLKWKMARYVQPNLYQGH
jgi:hypothetical protein